jgi:hypothetical protein
MLPSPLIRFLGFFTMASSSRRLLHDNDVERLVVNLCINNNRSIVHTDLLGIGKRISRCYRPRIRSNDGHKINQESTLISLTWTLAEGYGYPNAVVGGSVSGGGGEEGFTGRAAIGYDHGYDGEVFYLGLALDPHYVDGWVEGCLERIGEDEPDEEQLFRDLWEDETQREVVIESLKADCEVRTGRPAGPFEI